MKNAVKKGQLWKAKNSKKLLRIVGPWSGNRHWVVADDVRGNCGHHIHEGTLLKFYDLIHPAQRGSLRSNDDVSGQT